jgi:hypothetical protein
MICCVLFASNLVFCQQPLTKDTITKILQTDDYSNLNKSPYSKNKRDSFFVSLLDTTNTLVILNDKIFKIDAPECLNLKKEDILSQSFIKDESSASMIKYIIIIKTKL